MPKIDPSPSYEVCGRFFFNCRVRFACFEKIFCDFGQQMWCCCRCFVQVEQMLYHLKHFWKIPRVQCHKNSASEFSSIIRAFRSASSHLPVEWRRVQGLLHGDQRARHHSRALIRIMHYYEYEIINIFRIFRQDDPSVQKPVYNKLILRKMELELRKLKLLVWCREENREHRKNPRSRDQ